MHEGDAGRSTASAPTTAVVGAPPPPTSRRAPSSTTSARPSRCCSSRASSRSASPGCASRPRPSSWRVAPAVAAVARLVAATRRLVVAWGAVLATMNVCFYEAIARLPLGTVAAIEFVPVVVLASLGARTPRNGRALLLAVGGVALLTDVRLEGEPVGVAFAAANAVAVHALHRARAPRRGGAAPAPASTGWRRPCSSPPSRARRSRSTPRRRPSATRSLLLAAIGVGIASSVVPYVARPARAGAAAARHLRADGLAAARDRRADRARRPAAGAARRPRRRASRSWWPGSRCTATPAPRDVRLLGPSVAGRPGAGVADMLIDSPWSSSARARERRAATTSPRGRRRSAGTRTASSARRASRRRV